MPGYTLYSVNIGLSKVRGIIIYVKDEISESVTEMNTNICFEDACILQIRKEIHLCFHVDIEV